MALTVIIHINNEDAVVGEIEELPSPNGRIYPRARTPG